MGWRIGIAGLANGAAVAGSATVNPRFPAILNAVFAQRRFASKVEATETGCAVVVSLAMLT
jgi:hypothetical protein